MSKKPVIGISSSIIIDQGGMFPGYKRSYVNKDYVDSVIQAGGTPLIIPFSEDNEVIASQMELLDGLILSGGHDVFPYHYGQEPTRPLGEVFPERDKYEYELFKLAQEKNIPVLGICRGLQIMNTYAGGTLHQDLCFINSDKPILKHWQGNHPSQETHLVSVEEGSKLSSIFGEQSFLVNSFHHQVLDKVAEGYKVVAKASDVVVEAIEKVDANFVVGVQWHPEMMHKTNEKMAKLFATLVEKSRK